MIPKKADFKFDKKDEEKSPLFSDDFASKPRDFSLLSQGADRHVRLPKCFQTSFVPISWKDPSTPVSTVTAESSMSKDGLSNRRNDTNPRNSSQISISSQSHKAKVFSFSKTNFEHKENPATETHLNRGSFSRTWFDSSKRPQHYSPNVAPSFLSQFNSDNNQFNSDNNIPSSYRNLTARSVSEGEVKYSSSSKSYAVSNPNVVGNYKKSQNHMNCTKSDEHETKFGTKKEFPSLKSNNEKCSNSSPKKTLRKTLSTNQLFAGTSKEISPQSPFKGNSIEPTSPSAKDFKAKGKVRGELKVQPEESCVGSSDSSNKPPADQSKPSTSGSSENQDKNYVLVDTSEVSFAGSISATLRLKHQVETYILQINPASYVVSSRMAVFRQGYSVFSSTGNKGRLVSRIRALLFAYERPVVIVENDTKMSAKIPPRSFYLDTICSAFIQLPQLKILYSSDNNETADLISQLVSQERLKGNAIPELDFLNNRFQKAVSFYRTIPRISSCSAIFLAVNFPSLKDAVNSDVKELMSRGRMSQESAQSFKSHVQRRFRKDFLPRALKDVDI